ncbi:hypothetical protein ASZ90_002888 [hydrocarbon metagenome]|uniref:Amphi-Trp domain-containing protein n=1 Tax=hydrocarbon metagenome TaxID=938273 RepID=A0A0W8G237_9ZZZZ
MAKNKVKMEGMLELREVVARLEDVVSNLKAGSICMAVGEDCVTLRPTSIVSVSMKASQKKDKEKFSLELSWKTGPNAELAPEARISGAGFAD